MARFKEKLKWERLKRINWLIVGIFLVVVLMVSSLTTEYFQLDDLQTGETSPRNFVADRDYRLVDQPQTRKKIVDELSRLRPAFIFNTRREEQLRETLRQEVRKLPSEEVPGQTEEAIAALEQLLDLLFNRGIIDNKDVFERFEHQDEGVVYCLEAAEESPGPEGEIVNLVEFRRQLFELDDLDERLEALAANIFADPEAKQPLLALLVDNLKANVFFESETFTHQKEQVREEVTPEYIEVEEGEVILAAGEEVTELKYNLLRQINRARFRFQIWLGILRLAIIILGAVFGYLYLVEYEPEFFENPSKLALVCLLVVILTGLATFFHYLVGELGGQFEFMFPFATAPALVTILLSPALAVQFLIFLSIFVITYFSYSFQLYAMFVFGGLTAVFSVREVERRSELIRSGIYVGVVQMLAVVLFQFLEGIEFFTPEQGRIILWAGFNGAVITPFMVIGGLPFLENGFDITTNFKLQELADLNHPLLRKLFQKAPGSYQHSILLSNLCEQAASAIGASTLLMRAGTYFHDIGKAEVPEYFSENQGSQNPHDELKPTLSASILKTHVKKGVEIAKEHGLPDEIIGMIKQHHGTTRMQYFYHRALEESSEEVSEDEFRYPGPIPQFKEAALLMLGDSAEAASRSLEDPTHQKIESVVRGVIYDKFKQGQLNECELTLKDLDIIANVFTRVLASVHHKRVSYPEEEETEDLEEARQDENNDNQPD